MRRLVLLAGLVVGCSHKASRPAPPPTPAASFTRYCAACHGSTGRGDGPVAALLDPRPRDFAKGAYRLVSSQNGVASEDDLERVIRLGMPGTAMPPWPALDEPARRGLARYLLGLWRDKLVADAVAKGKPPAEAEKKAATKTTPGPAIVPPPPPTGVSAAEGRDPFVKTCATCHVEDGTGKIDPAWRTAEGFPISSRNLVHGVFKGGREDTDLYRRIAAGIPGTPMPSFATLPSDQIWRLVRFVQALSDPRAEERAWVRSHEIAAARVAALPAAADDPAWQAAPETVVELLPMSAAAPPELRVRAVHDGKGFALLVDWRGEAGEVSAALGDDPSAPLYLPVEPLPGALRGRGPRALLRGTGRPRALAFALWPRAFTIWQTLATR